MTFKSDALDLAEIWSKAPAPKTVIYDQNGIGAAWVNDDGLLVVRYADKTGMPQTATMTVAEARNLGGTIQAFLQELDTHFTDKGVVWR